MSYQSTELFSFKDAETIRDRANWNTSFYCWSFNCYNVNETRKVLDTYVKLLRENKVDVYNPKKNSGTISGMIQKLTYAPLGRIQRILYEMYFAIKDKSVVLPETVIDETAIFKPEEITPDKILTEESGFSWFNIALFGGVGVVLWYYFANKK